MTTYVTPKKNTEYIFYIGLVSQANPSAMQSNPTIAAGDFKVSTDGGAFANPATLPAVTPASGKAVKVTLSASEMNGDNIIFYGSDASGAEWCDVLVNIQTSARQIDDLAYPATSGRSMVVDAAGLVDANAVKVGPTGSGTAQTARDLGGTLGAAGAGLTAVPWNASWDAEVQSEVQDALDGTIADSVPADGTRPSISSGIYMIQQFLTEKAVSGTTVTVKKPDGSTTLFTLTLDSSTDPTSITRSG